MPRSRTYPENLRDRLVAAAYQRLRVSFPEDVSLRELATECDTSTNAVYSIFGGKDALIAAVVADARHDFLERQFTMVDGEPTLEALAASGTEYRAWARENPHLYRLMFGGDVRSGTGFTLADEMLDPLRLLVGRLMQLDVIRTQEVEDVCLSLWASTHGFVLLEMNLWPDGSPHGERLYRLHLENCVVGLLTPRARAALAG